MEEYPEEWRSPPVTLVALVGCPEHHHSITTHFASLQPPINTLALPDFSKINLLLSSSDNNNNNKESIPGGILKRDWLLKHRFKVPAVVAALFSYHQLSADPSQWLDVCSQIENLKSLLRPKNIKLLLLVVQSSKDDNSISEDRMIALQKRAELDPKHVLILSLDLDDSFQLQQSLDRVSTSFAELATAYYRDEGRRIKTRLEKKAFGSVEFNVRYCFKVAVYAEFGRDWVEAVRFYEEAYRILREMIGTSTRLPATQRLVEIKTVAELLHFKIATLMLHSGKVIEAVTWFRQHNTAYKRLVGAPEAIFLHWEWMSKQFLVFAELLETSSGAIQSSSTLVFGNADRPLTEWEFYPAYYYQLAAHYMKEKRLALELSITMSDFGDEADSSVDSVVPSVYIGQFARLLEHDNSIATQPLTDEEYIRYAVAEGKRFQDSFEIVALLKKSYELFSNLNAQRMASLCGLQMAREYFSVGNFCDAKQIFDTVATLYRKEGWVTFLWEVLGYLRECSRKQAAIKDFIEYSLEMAALPVASETSTQSFISKECGPAGPASLHQRESIHKEIFGLVTGEIGSAPIEEYDDLKLTGDNPIHLEIDLVSPLRLVLLASVAFHHQIIKPGVATSVTFSLLSQLPLDVEIDQIEVQFNQSNCNFIIINPQKPPLPALSKDQQGFRVEHAASLVLTTNKWLRLTYAVKSECSGKLECLSVTAKVGPHLTIGCRAESPASMDDLPLWKFEDRVDTFPTKDRALAFYGQKAAQVEEADPQVDLILGASGPALVGECFSVPVSVVSRGHAVHSGELKINLVDVRGGGLFSPRETEAASMDSHHVELLGISGSEGEDESQLGFDKIKKIQQSFGLVSVPSMKDGESWSCKLEIKWHRPKPVMLFVSLGYSPHTGELTSQKVHVHKNLQIEGKTPVLISQHFMHPFRQNPLLLSRINPGLDSDQLASLPLNETSILVVCAKNCCGVPLQIESMSIEKNDDGIEKSCSLQDGAQDWLPALLVPGEDFKKVFVLKPEVKSSKLRLGMVDLKWRRSSGLGGQSCSTAPEDSVVTKHELPDVNVELSPIIVSFECPPYAVLGDPFTYLIKIRNQTQLLQEVKFSLADTQSSVLSGSHNDTTFVLPKSERILSYKTVPLASGLQQLPKVSLTSVRYSAGFQPSDVSSTVFVFPSKPHFKIANPGEEKIKSQLAE
ncbi:trafficking protein particle complex subunit 11 [Tripterygium wilfordii]|uniref:Trafficking protein particle complex subunit 11 n=1 Tax=Tripterygium wilfordii TaxID=458696 RepID=A0A7J7E1K1_TRIWF|nr:trafficking protein particle complex subunit 11 [Tripterygium wilfordii]KAF5752467.1 trafficking protein particle complex subunit 11 [Tripterygium wilfordii]